METMSIQEVMDALKVSRAYVYLLRKRGELRIVPANPVFRKGGPARIPKEDVDAILAKRA